MRIFPAALLALALTGCANTPKWLENRLTCTVAGGEALVVSRWGPIGIAADIASEDAKVICQPQISNPR